MSHASAQYENHQNRRDRLAELIAQARPVFAALDMATWAEAADRLAERLRNERFRVMILGEFKRGKSTFINAILHNEVLPADIAPCTAVINEVKWGDVARALLHFRHPLPDRPAALPPDARRHVERHRYAAVPPMEIAVKELDDFVRIPDPSADQAASVSETPYERVELYWPLELCRNGVEIIDSPGLNEHHTRTKTTRDYLAHIDAVIFVMSVHALGSESELAVVDHDLRPVGHDHLFFVCNRFDELRRREDREKIVNYAYSKLADRTRFGREGIFFVSAIDALEGRLAGDTVLVGRSGIEPLERKLEQFLVTGRGRVKLLQAVVQFSHGLRAALNEVIPGKRKFLDEDVAVLQRRVEEARPKYEKAVARRKLTLENVESARERVRDCVRREAERYYTNLSVEIPVWVRRMDSHGRINPLKFWKATAQANELAAEIDAWLRPVIEDSFARWHAQELIPLVQQQLNALADTLGGQIDAFLAQLEGVRFAIAGREGNEQGVAAGDVTTAERVLAGLSGMALAGPGLAFAGVTGGSKGMITNLLPQVAMVITTQVLAVAVGVTNPLAIAAILLGSGVLKSKFEANALTEKIKTQIGEKMAEDYRANSPRLAAEIADAVYENTRPLAQAVAEQMSLELKTVREQMDAVVRNKQQGEAYVNRHRQEVSAHEATLRSINDQITELALSLGS
ncbi:MAG: dynamin family protein [Isosphaeraceae bacterium]